MKLNFIFESVLLSFVNMFGFPVKCKIYYDYFECLSIAFEEALKWFVLFAAF